MPRYTKTLDAKDVAEVDVITFDYSAELGDGETLSSAVVTVEVYEGADPAFGDMIDGAPQISGAYVLQQMKAGVANVTYLWRCVATTSLRVLTLSGYIPVRRL